jgi:hypothetical protein
MVDSLLGFVEFSDVFSDVNRANGNHPPARERPIAMIAAPIKCLFMMKPPVRRNARRSASQNHLQYFFLSYVVLTEIKR